MKNLVYFKDDRHKEAFMEYSKNVSPKAYTQIAVIYLLTSTEHLRASYFNLFGNGYIDLRSIEEIGLSKGEILIVAFALDLYNGQKIKGIDTSPSNVLANLDDELKKVCLHALLIKFNLLINIDKDKEGSEF